jgi:hypothetical protein
LERELEGKRVIQRLSELGVFFFGLERLSPPLSSLLLLLLLLLLLALVSAH